MSQADNFQSRLSSLRRLARYMLPYWKAVPLIVACLLLLAWASVYQAFQAEPVLDQVLDQGDMSALIRVCTILAGLALVLAATHFGYTYFTRRIIVHMDRDIRVNLFSHLLTLSLRFYHQARRGELISRLTNDLGITHGALMLLLGDVLLSPFLLIAFTIGAFIKCWPLALSIFIGIPLFIFPLAKLGKRLRKAVRRRQAQIADLTQDMSQAFSGIRIVKAFRMEGAEEDSFRQLSHQYVRRTMRGVELKTFAEAATQLLTRAAIPVALFVGGYLLFHGYFDLTRGRLVAFLFCVGLMAGPAKKLTKAYNKVQEALVGAERIFELLDTKPIITDRPDAIDLPPIAHSIAFRHLTFAYDTIPVLRDIDLEVKAGEIIALVGHSGAGKSTLLDLIPRFYDPQTGGVEIDGIDIRKVHRDSLLRQIAIVGQEPFLFHATIRENIRYGRPDATDDDIVEAARAAYIHDFIQGLPNGYETVTGERGVALSGGQRQRITIARALVRNAPILILDEATSSLDKESERLVQAALHNLMEGRTTFVIAHRLSTVQHAHRIVVLREGRLVEMGDHATLLDQRGEYWRFHQMEFSAVINTDHQNG